MVSYGGGKMKKNWWVVLIPLAAPILIAALSRFPIFKYSPGSVESWIGYWGSYLGAMIGASVVYFVSKMQIKEQNQLQLDAIDKENKITLNREMEQYYFRLEVEKLEELFNEIDIFNKTITNSYNEFVKYITNTHILYDGQDNPSQEEIDRFTLEVRELRLGLMKWINEGYSNLLILKRLSMYIDDSKPSIIAIEDQFDIYVKEIRKAYGSNHGYKVYLSKENPGKNLNLIESRGVISGLINNLSTQILQPNLQGKINIMRNSKTL